VPDSGALPGQGDPPRVVVHGGGYWPDASGETYVAAPLLLEFDNAGDINVMVPNGNGEPALWLCAVPVSGIAAALAASREVTRVR
jgi:hypothetical protein